MKAPGLGFEGVAAQCPLLLEMEADLCEFFGRQASSRMQRRYWLVLPPASVQLVIAVSSLKMTLFLQTLGRTSAWKCLGTDREHAGHSVVDSWK